MRSRAIVVVLVRGLCLLLSIRVVAQTANNHATAAAKQAEAAFCAGYGGADAGDLEKARRSFAEVVRLEPKIPEGHAALGSVLLNLGRPSEAAVELKRGLALRPTDANMQMNLALAEVRAGQSSEALPLFKELSAQNTALPSEVEIAYAQALTQAGQRPAALDRLRAAVAAGPDNAALHDALGSLLAQEQQWAGAQPEFARAVELDPKLIAARLHLARVLMQLNQPADAAAMLEAARAEQPQDVAILNELALSYTAQGSYDKALVPAQE